jgi:ankyrin repeat protein
LHAAACGGSVEVAELLLAHGVNINAGALWVGDYEEGIGRTPLMVAVNNARVGMIEWLLANGADVSIQIRHGSSALSCALGYFDKTKALQMAEILTARGASDPDSLKRLEELKRNQELRHKYPKMVFPDWKMSGKCAPEEPY